MHPFLNTLQVCEGLQPALLLNPFLSVQPCGYQVLPLPQAAVRGQSQEICYTGGDFLGKGKWRYRAGRWAIKMRKVWWWVRLDANSEKARACYSAVHSYNFGLKVLEHTNRKQEAFTKQGHESWWTSCMQAFPKIFYKMFNSFQVFCWAALLLSSAHHFFLKKKVFCLESTNQIP